ncbi:hypothetical protein GCM10011387_18240 [Pedobacter quisquiliarum]|uniref:Glycosyl transferase family 1 domain-containing protein n=1 Tax=Pedobacter quisquiliarum TaxID=1834438 RepID=A0A916XE06_9SPHI|nr:hypothetical protein GCM10011387_18240 [Pedobacter quisquiliarum]
MFYPAELEVHKPLNFLFIGRLEKSKGIEIFLELAARFPAFNFNIIGAGKLIDSVIEACSTMNNLAYLGQLENFRVADILRSSDFLILPSVRLANIAWEELFGISIIEAMACGVIPITSDHVGPSEIIKNHLDGFICSDGNLQAELFKLLKELLEVNDETLLTLKQNAIRSASRYQVHVISSKWGLILDQYIHSN